MKQFSLDCLPPLTFFHRHIERVIMAKNVTPAIHTTAPYALLTEICHPYATVAQGVTGHNDPDCFYGWGEKQTLSDCRAHNIVWGGPVGDLMRLAHTLFDAKHEIVVTEPVTNDQFGDHEVMRNAPMFYRDRHKH